MKACKSCGVQRPVEDYYRMEGTTDGLSPYCRKCRRLQKVGR